MPINHRAEIEWAPKVSLSKIRQLYLKDAQGICDDELVNAVGISLYSRCASILEFTEACQGKVTCKRCARNGQSTIIERKTSKPAEQLKCPVCGWQVQWRVYVNEAEKTGGNLMEGHAGAAFRRYIETYPQCQNAREKIVAIDLLIHEFHWILVGEDQEQGALLPHKPAGVNLLQGSAQQIVEFLNELTYGQATSPDLLANREWWLAQKPVARQLAPR
jgi:hypothetical protein